MKTFWNFLIWLDMKINDDWLGGHFETISSRCYRKSRAKPDKCHLCCWLCKGLGKIDRNHCKNSYHSDRLRNPDLPVL